MKRTSAILILLFIILFSIPSFTAEPGGTKTWMAYFYVIDQDGNPVGNVDIELIVTTWYGDPLDPSYYTCYEYGVTGSDGYGYLECVIPGQYADGLDEMRANVIDTDFTVISSQNTYTYSNQAIWPQFTVIHDTDGNGVKDEWEMPLAQKFCPSLTLHDVTEWIAPEPVVYIGVTKQDLWFILYNSNGQFVNDYPIEDEALFVPPINTYYPWMSQSSSPDFSFVTGNGYVYTGNPPGPPSYGQYYLRFHFNYIGNNGDITSPSDWIAQYETERQQNQFPHTTYAHLFLHNNKPVIQYWFFYPYNDGYNNHEGDWEHINVRLSDQDPALATIEAIDFYFHNKVKTLTSGYQLVDGTHPNVYVGGSCAGVTQGFSCQPGNATGGSYPWTGTWYNVGPNSYDEYVNGLGPTIAYNSITIVIIPEPDKIDYSVQPEMSWLNVSIRWGNLEVSSPWDWIEPFIHPLTLGWVEGEIGNDAPPGPYHNNG